MNKPMPTPRDLLSRLLALFEKLSPTEQLGLKGLAALVLVGLCWLLIVNPVQQIWFNPKDESARLGLEIQELQRIQSQVQALRAQTRMSPDEAKKALEKVTKNILPQAQWTPSQDAVQITFSAVSASNLARWLLAVRENAQCTVLQADLRPGSPQTPNASRPMGSSSTKDPVLWQGQLMVGLPH